MQWSSRCDRARRPSFVKIYTTGFGRDAGPDVCCAIACGCWVYSEAAEASAEVKVNGFSPYSPPHRPLPPHLSIYYKNHYDLPTTSVEILCANGGHTF